MTTFRRLVEEVSIPGMADLLSKAPQLARVFPTPTPVDSPEGTTVARQTRYGGKETVVLYPSFFDANTPHEWVLAHEYGHLAQTYASISGTTLYSIFEKYGVDPWVDLPFGQFNMDEAFADCFASWIMGDGEVQSRYPDWALVVEDLAKVVGL